MSSTKSFSEFLRLPDMVMFIEICITVALGLTISWIIHIDGWGAIGDTITYQNGITIQTPGDPFLLWRIVVWAITSLISLIIFSYHTWRSE